LGEKSEGKQPELRWHGLQSIPRTIWDMRGDTARRSTPGRENLRTRAASEHNLIEVIARDRRRAATFRSFSINNNFSLPGTTEVLYVVFGKWSGFLLETARMYIHCVR
jgi:hypothetical protein